MNSKAEQLGDAKKRVREAFIVFETKEGSRLANTKDISTILRALGINPTTAQVQVLLDQILPAVPSEQSSTVALEQCEDLIASWLLETKDSLVRDDYHVLMRAFKALDPDEKGYIDAEQLRAVLTTCDDALSAEECNSMISTAADDQGRILYQEYALKLAADGKNYLIMVLVVTSNGPAPPASGISTTWQNKHSHLLVIYEADADVHAACILIMNNSGASPVMQQ